MSMPKDEYDALVEICRKNGIPENKIDAVAKDVYERMGGGDVGYLWRKLWKELGDPLDVSKFDCPFMWHELNRIADERGEPLETIKQEFLDYGQGYIEELNEIQAMDKAAKKAGMSYEEYRKQWISAQIHHEGGNA